ncbi:hypothetical protein [Kutzneria sp. CA-103260]|uniref:hypothetical protein n=1 Tax=Kutzneria sp. CA-103260 TaxID=2802641 RepID=UPI001BAA5832|nr:hypothetical protein [Kutzneria sp. CA-103260]QUQ62707.1 hypothetical protein JJ691_04190 [Kutzneria sp. CA-103260]
MCWQALGTSQVFCGQIALLEKHSTKQPSGVPDTGWDEVRIDPPVLREFLRVTLEDWFKDITDAPHISC